MCPFWLFCDWIGTAELNGMLFASLLSVINPSPFLSLKHFFPPSFPPAPVAGQRRCLPCSQPQPPLGAPHADATASSLSRCRSPRRTAAALTFL
ncbi:hypothetical protein B296_00040358 [Ensete ventricosum]|uniref:Uncharacterized protein n=1 Tax=Ensete ventricosum TaxID=4639 RepID=A0A426YCV3_ENSVE|nr:hypothetical protein B296_00040358 [Ensete ventricosum]